MRIRANLLCMAALVITALPISSHTARADRGSPVAASCPEELESRYFPVGVDLSLRQLYSKHLAVMGEPSLSCGTLEDTETYRFLWLRSFQPSIAVRVFRRGDNYGLESVILDGDLWFDEPAHVSRRVTKELSLGEGRTVISGLAEMQSGGPQRVCPARLGGS